MNHCAEIKEFLKQTLSEDFSEAILQIAQKYLTQTPNESCITAEVEDMIFREVSTSEAFCSLQNNVCIDLSSRKYDRHSSYGPAHEGETCTCMFRSPIEVKANGIINAILESLHCLSLSCRLQALDSFANLISTEQMSLSNWEVCEAELQTCLIHPIRAISDAATAVYINALCSSSPFVVKESYSSLLKVTLQILSQDMMKQLGANFTVVCNILNIVINFQKNVSKHWLRYPEEVIKSLIEETFLHYFNVQSSGILFILFDLIDPCLSWLCSWLCCKPSRLLIFSTLEKHKHFIHNLLTLCKDHNDPKMSEYKSIQVAQASKFLINLASFEPGCKIISEIMNDSFRGDILLVLLLDVTAHLENAFVCKQFEYAFQKILCLSGMFENEKTSTGNGICKTLMSVIENSSISENHTNLVILLKSLEHVSASASGKQILSDPLFFSALKHCGIDALAEEVVSEVSLSFLCIMGNLLDCSKGAEQVLEYNLIRSIFEFYFRLRRNMNDFLLKLSSHHLGLYYCSMNMNHDMVNDFICQNRNFILNKLHTNCSCINARSLYQLLTFCCFKTNNFHLVYPFFIETCSQKENSCICYSLHLNSSKTMLISTMSLLAENYISLFITSGSLDDINLNHILSPLEKGLSCSECTEQTLLLVLCMCVNNLRISFCLEAVFGIQDYLIGKQVAELEDGKMNVTEKTVLRNHFLVKTILVGASTERILPPLTIGNEDYDFPFLLSKNTLPEFWSLCGKSMKEKCEKCNFNELVHDLSSLREFLLGNFQSECKNAILHFSCIERFFENSKNSALEQSYMTSTYSDIVEYGLKVAVNYGVLLNMLLADVSIEGHVESLKKLMHFSHMFYKISLSNDCFDFLAATIYIITAGKVEIAKNLITFAHTKEKYFLYFGEIFYTILAKEPSFQKGKLCLFFDTIVEERLPSIHSKLMYFGVRPSNMWMFWTSQIFWNNLGIEQIFFFVLICLVCGAEYSLYFSVALLKFLEKEIIHCHNIYDLHLCLYENNFEGFCVFQEVAFLSTLNSKYRDSYKCISSLFNTHEKY